LTVVVSLTGVTPPARYDGLPWTTARIQEAATAAGSYTQIEAVTLNPVDSDPSDPLSRDFTSTLGTAASQFYRVIFRDAAGFDSPASPVVQNTTATTAYATADQLSPLIHLNRATPTTDQAAAMTRVLLAAAGEINAEIGRTSLAGWELALATEVNLERAVEHWKQAETSFGIVGLGDGTVGFTATDSWRRHAEKLAPLKRSWGVA
jgi:hypothetical protein